MDNNLKYTCLFGGGAIRGVSYIGAIKAMEELGVQIGTFGGSSVGSIIAGLLAVGYTADELKQIFIKVNFELFKDISIGLGPLFAISKGEVFLEWVRELIETKFYGENYKKGANKAVTFKDIEKNLVIITTNLSNFECKEFSKFETPDYEIASAIRISSCMPGLMKPIEYNNTLLVDGDLQKSLPMWKLSKNLLRDDARILEFRLEGDYDKNNISGIDYANAVYSCMTAMSTLFIKSLYGANDKYDYIVLNTGDIVIVDFNMNEAKRNELIESGYNQTMEYFSHYLTDKKVKIKKCYEKILSFTNRMHKFISAKKIIKTKIELGELFIELADLSSMIDKDDYNAIKSFKDLLLQNIKYPPLFGAAKLANETLVKTELTRINNKFKTKTADLTEYINKYQNKQIS